MTPTTTALLLIALAIAVLISLAAAAGATVLKLWDGAGVPAAVGRGLTAFGGTMTLCGALIALLISAFR
ncbi:hypothetical protein OHA37_38490 [Streptomyces sp. NBC_00335]|uniref:hypothetical protein n=1 Tax=unclassified Streptomyces TaxID=2593676 RepID=UPI002258DC7F|nr:MULTISPECIES: hypothetical protein [unclassified Streptomyces]MCX5409732.1 hypothetical protein [Streptomyces sp. NBC_00086]